MKFIVYLTKYRGKLLPLWYIGSTYYDNVKNGYNGSVSSKKYKEIYKMEQKENKHLFKTKILSYHKTRKEALEEELRLQKKHKVVKNSRYINESYACVNRFFGRLMNEEEKKNMVEKRKLSGNGDYHNGNNPFSDKNIQKKIIKSRKNNGNWHGFDLNYKGIVFKTMKELSKCLNHSESKLRKHLIINNIRYLNDIMIDNILFLSNLEPKDKKWLYRNLIEKDGIKYYLYYKLNVPEGYKLIKEYKVIR